MTACQVSWWAGALKVLHSDQFVRPPTLCLRVAGGWEVHSGWLWFPAIRWGTVTINNQ